MYLTVLFLHGLAALVCRVQPGIRSSTLTSVIFQSTRNQTAEICALIRNIIFISDTPPICLVIDITGILGTTAEDRMPPTTGANETEGRTKITTADPIRGTDIEGLHHHAKDTRPIRMVILKKEIQTTQRTCQLTLDSKRSRQAIP